LQAELVAGAVVSAGKRQVVRVSRDVAEQDVGSDEFAAAREEPAEFVERDVCFTAFDHHLDFFKVLSPIAGFAGIQSIASLPSREQLIAKILFLLQSPITRFARVLAAVPQSFVSVLDQVRIKKESA